MSDHHIELTESQQMSHINGSKVERVAECDPLLLHPENSELISKFGHGGPRENSGGYRPGAGRKPKPATAVTSLGERWCVVEAEPNRLDRAVHSLIEMGFSPYVATHPVRVKSPLKGAQAPVFTMVPRPMFFGFFFVRIDMDGFGWAKIRPAPADGIRRLLLTPALRPAPVRAGLIEALIDDEPRRLQMPDRALPKCAAGETVLVVRGPFAGQVVTVESCDGYTTVVWLNAFGGQTRTTLSRRDVSDE